MKNFSPSYWNETLATFNFCTQAESEAKDINILATEFANTINDALDICAPKKTFTIRPNYVQGLSEKAKSLMKVRDLTRSLFFNMASFYGLYNVNVTTLMFLCLVI